MHKLIAAAVTGCVLPLAVLTAPAEAATRTILFSNSDYSWKNCSVRNSGTAKTSTVRPGSDRKVSAKTGQVKCGAKWRARTFGTARGPVLKANTWYRIGGQNVPLSWIVVEQVR